LIPVTFFLWGAAFSSEKKNVSNLTISLDTGKITYNHELTTFSEMLPMRESIDLILM
jgi:hypothetical protein